jgi:hypothetical protein
MILMGRVLMRVVLTGATAFARLRCCNPARDRLANMNVTGLVHWYWEGVLAPCGPAPDTKLTILGEEQFARQEVVTVFTRFPARSRLGRLALMAAHGLPRRPVLVAALAKMEALAKAGLGAAIQNPQSEIRN